MLLRIVTAALLCGCGAVLVGHGAEPAPGQVARSERRGIVATQLDRGKLTFEIPLTLLGRDVAIVGRITSGRSDPQFKDVPGLPPNRGPVPWTPFANAVVRIEEGPGPTLVVRKQAPAGSDQRDGIGGEALAEVPVARRAEGGGLVVDGEALLQRSKLGFRGKWATQPDVAHFTRAVHFPDRAELHATTDGKEGPIGLQWSIRPLPKEPMRPRLADPRVNFSFNGRFIQRWRLVKKDPKAAASDPLEPILVYLDSSIPERWREDVTEGVLQWNRAFEAAGFTNAVTVKMAPASDPDWSPFDLRHAITIWWKGGHGGNCWTVSDPRSGEILNAVVTLFDKDMWGGRTEYFLRAGGVDPAAAEWPVPERVLGHNVRRLAAHETGHAFGFDHNFTSVFPADKLRDPAWTGREGSSPTIMGYNAYNRVAQPGDGVAVDGLWPRVGLFDLFAAHWGYAEIPAAATPQAERAVLDQWATAAQKTPWLRYKRGGVRNARHLEPWNHRPRGDAEWPAWAKEHIDRTRLYLANSRRIAEGLADWNAGEGGQDLIVLARYFRLFYREPLVGVAEVVSAPVPAETKREALRLLNEEAFGGAAHVYAPAFLKRWDEQAVLSILRLSHSEIFAALLDAEHLKRLTENADASGYSLRDLVADLQGAVWRELDEPKPTVTRPRQLVQVVYVQQLKALMGRPSQPDRRVRLKLPKPASGEALTVFSDEVAKLSKAIRKAIERSGDGETRSHLEALLQDLSQIEGSP